MYTLVQLWRHKNELNLNSVRDPHGTWQFQYCERSSLSFKEKNNQEKHNNELNVIEDYTKTFFTTFICSNHGNKYSERND